jgi:branched-chain amino acid transport system substrate-binding protein
MVMAKTTTKHAALAFGALLGSTALAVAATPTGKPILVGLIAGTTGAYGTTGVQTVQGAQVAVDKLNADGGVLGRPVKLEWYNDNASGTVSGELFKKLVSEGAVAIVGSPDTGPVTAQLADRYKVPAIGVVDGGGLTVYPDGPDGKPHAWVFEFGGNTFAWGGKVAEHALKHCPGGLAVLHDKTTYGLGGFYGIRQVYDKAGKKLATDQAITENWSTGATTGLLPEIAAAKKAGADCVVVWLTPQDQAAFMQDLKTTGDKFTVYGNDETNADATFVNLAGDSADGVIGAFLTSTMRPSPELTAFIDVYKKKFNEEPSQYSETTYDSVMMLAEMMKQTNSDDPAKIQAQFNKTTDYQGITGKVTFNEQKHVSITPDDLTLVRYNAKTKTWDEVKD